MRRPRITPVELATAAVLVIVLALVLLPLGRRATEARGRDACADNLKQIGLALKMYAGEHRGLFPPTSPIAHNWVPDPTAMFPEYLTDPGVFICPGSPFAADHTFTRLGPTPRRRSPECITSLFYVYTGFTITDDETAFALYQTNLDGLAGASNSRMVNVAKPVFNGAPPSGGLGQAGIPVVWDRVGLRNADFSHRAPLGGNVLHMDGHVAFVPFDQRNNSRYFPMTQISAETFGSIVPPPPPGCTPLLR